MSINIAVDLGTSYTSIYKQGEGLVLREPTAVAVKNGGEESFFGQQAKKLIGKTAENISILFPVFEGMITNKNAAAQLLKYFLSKVIKKTFFTQRIKLVMTVPCGIPAEEKLKYEEAAHAAGIREVLLIDSPLAISAGIGEYIDNYSPVFFVDIGGGKSEIAAVSSAGIISGCTLGIGGNNADTGIIDYIINEHGIKVGLLSAEKIKIQIGSFYPGDNASMMVNGRSVSSGKPESILLSSKNINSILDYYYSKILDVAEASIKALPPEVSGEIKERGVFLCGGASLIPGIDNYFYKRLQIPVKAANEPSYTCITGAGRILSDTKLLNRLAGIK
jgi:rod shape-determining protein MreB